MANNLARIRKEVGKGLQKAGLLKPATLIVVTAGARDPSNLTAGPTLTETSVSCKGLVTTWKKSFLGATTIVAGDRVVLLTGKHLGATVPAIGNKITIEGVTSRIVDIERDPASAAFSCLTRS